MIVSIDIGTSYSSMSVLGKDGKPVSVEVGDSAYGSKYSMPTAVYLQENGELLKGQSAVNMKVVDPTRFCDNFKRNFGEPYPVLIGEKEFRIEELYTEIFVHMCDCIKKITDEKVERVYLTYPASYGQDKKEKLIGAAKSAGFFDVIPVEEPVAAAMDQWACGNVKSGQTVLIYDFGGGTFDVAIIKCEDSGFSQVGMADGIAYCGGIDMDRAILKNMLEALGPALSSMKENTGSSEDEQRKKMRLRFERILEENAVKIKHQLSGASEATVNIPMGWDVLPYTLKRDDFERMIAPLVGKTISCCEKLLEDAGVSKKELSAVIMAGGTSRIPLVGKMVKMFAGETPVFLAMDPDLTVVQGALNYESFRNKEQKPEELLLQAEKFMEKGKYDEATKLYRMAAESGDAKAQYEYAFQLEYFVDDATEDEVYCWMMKSAEQGYSEAQYDIGSMLEEKNPEEAAVWYRKAAENGDIHGILEIADCYDEGKGVSENKTEAARWYRKGAEIGECYCCLQLAICYENGSGVSQDYAEAAKWYRKAAEQGSAMAQACLGSLYYRGCGVPEDDKEAVKWFRLAAEQGDDDGQFCLGLCYYRGHGVTEDEEEAVKWFKLAAEQGNETAQYNLGRCYYLGEGITKNRDEAKKWLREATEQGNSDASELLETLEDADLLEEFINQSKYNWVIDYDILKSFSEVKDAKDAFIIYIGDDSSDGEAWGIANKPVVPEGKPLYIYSGCGHPPVSDRGFVPREISASQVTISGEDATIRLDGELKAGDIISDVRLPDVYTFWGTSEKQEDGKYTLRVDVKMHAKAVFFRNSKFAGGLRKFLIYVDGQKFTLKNNQPIFPTIWSGALLSLLGGNGSGTIRFLNSDVIHDIRVANAQLLDSDSPVLENGKWDLFDDRDLRVRPGMDIWYNLTMGSISAEIYADGKKL